MNFNNVFRWHLPFLFLVLLTFRAAAADTLLILGDSLSAGYRMSASAAWPALLNDKWQSKTSVVNASISGDTSQQGLARLPALLRGESSAESRNGAKALLEQLGLGKRLDHLPAQL
ncbi:GDSL-type esterase/lipase family protein, partial [Escherichia coli]